jgi:hypothetical protein
MKKGIALAAVVLGGILFAVAAGARPLVTIDTGLGRMFGNTTYEISVCEYIPDYELTACAESELEFPLDVWRADLNLGLEGTISGRAPWRAEIAIGTNIGDPAGKMLDSDRISIPDWGVSETFSYTESTAEADVLVLDLSGRIAFFARPRLRLEAVLGYAYEDFSYEIFGVEGWQLDLESGERIYFSEFHGVNVLDYDITYNVPYLGMSMRSLPSRSLTIDAEILYSPRASAEDRDDHILRNKTAESDCDGSAYMGSVEVTWKPQRYGGGLRWYLGAGFDLTHIATDGAQTQRWYGDDPVDPDHDETGLVVSGIDTEIVGSHQTVFFRAGLEF